MEAFGSFLKEMQGTASGRGFRVRADEPQKALIQNRELETRDRRSSEHALGADPSYPVRGGDRLAGHLAVVNIQAGAQMRIFS